MTLPSPINHQDFLLDPDTKVGSILIDAKMEVKSFVRLEVGQDLD